MRFLSFHCDYFRYSTTKRSRSRVFEELTEKNKEGSLENLIVFFISIEKQDETDDQIFQKCIIEIEKITTQLKVKNIVLLSFAHLFGELSSPEFGLSALKEIENLLNKKKYEILRPPFGWFNELELKAKGHPLSRISRKIN
jgi:threonyl-tRNA synthetase